MRVDGAAITDLIKQLEAQMAEADSAAAGAVISHPQVGVLETELGAAARESLPSTNEAPISSSMDRELYDAKLAAAEARTDTKFAELLGELKVISASVAGLTSQISDVKADIAGVRNATASVKWNILAMGLAIGGLIVAIAAFGAQILDLATSLVGVRR